MQFHLLIFITGVTAAMIGAVVLARAYLARKKETINLGMYLMLIGIFLELLANYLKNVRR